MSYEISILTLFAVICNELMNVYLWMIFRSSVQNGLSMQFFRIIIKHFCNKNMNKKSNQNVSYRVINIREESCTKTTYIKKPNSPTNQEWLSQTPNYFWHNLKKNKYLTFSLAKNRTKSIILRKYCSISLKNKKINSKRRKENRWNLTLKNLLHFYG